MIDVFLNGCFNILHAGHVELLEFASQYGDVTVGLNADPYVEEKYGELAVPLVNRAYCLRSNVYVDDIIVFNDNDASRLIRKLKPRYYIKGPDYRGQDLLEEAACFDTNTQIIIQPAHKIHNSSDLVHGLPRSGLIPLDHLG